MDGTPVAAALDVARRDEAVFPFQWLGARCKQPLTLFGIDAATTETAPIRAWWGRWPTALIGRPTGRIVVLDIDTKHDAANGYDTLEELGRPILPATWLVHTASGGLHVYFDAGGLVEIRNSAGKLGPGLDVRGRGGYIIAPSPGSGYSWDPHWNPDTASIAPIPDWLVEALTEIPVPDQSPRPVIRQSLSRYGEGALDNAVDRIVAAPGGEQRQTLNREVFAIAGLVAGGSIGSALALEALHWAARQMPSFDPARPWRSHELKKIIDAAFLDGLTHPRRPGRAA